MSVPYIPIFSSEQLSHMTHEFARELHDASQTKQNSIAFIKNPLPTVPLVTTETPFQVMSIGGTVFKKALVKKTQSGRISILSSRSYHLPVIDDASVLLDYIAHHVHPQTHVIAINFAYALEPTLRNGYLDGILLHGSKEHTFKGLIKQKIGKTIEEHLLETLGKKISVTVANDTVCLVLSGLERFSREPLVGGIVGTGTNFGFFLNEHSIVNLESGNFNRFHKTETGILIDKQSVDPGSHLFEKEVAGKYLYLHYNNLIQKYQLPYEPVSTTQELADLVLREDDCSILAHGLFVRSASMIAAMIAGIYEFRNKQHTDIIMEGSLFWKYDHYESIVMEYLDTFDIPAHAITFHYIKNSNILGPAHLASYGA